MPHSFQDACAVGRLINIVEICAGNVPPDRQSGVAGRSRPSRPCLTELRTVRSMKRVVHITPPVAHPAVVCALNTCLSEEGRSRWIKTETRLGCP